jgi:hypothetical protein
LQRASEFWNSTYNRLDLDENDIEENQDSQDEEDEEDEEETDDDEEEDEEEEDETLGMVITDDETVTEPQSELRRFSTMNNTELLEDLAAIVRILRQINLLHRIFYSHTPDRALQLMEPSDMDEGVDEEATKLLEDGLADLQTVLTTEHRRQSTLALLALLTYEQTSNNNFLRHFLDANGEYNPTLAMFAAATYDYKIEQPKCCRDIINAAEELCGPDWLEEFQKGKESVLKSMLDKLSFVAKIRLKMRDMNDKVIR